MWNIKKDLNVLMERTSNTFRRLKYDPSEIKLLIDSCESSLKHVLLHNGNEYNLIPIKNSVDKKKKHGEIKTNLDLIKKMSERKQLHVM